MSYRLDQVVTCWSNEMHLALLYNPILALQNVEKPMEALVARKVVCSRPRDSENLNGDIAVEFYKLF